MKLTKKEKQVLRSLLNHDYTLTALDYDYAEDNEKDFKEQNGCSFKYAEKLLDKVINQLK